MQRILLSILIFGVFGLLGGCGIEEDHSNPFDPASGVYITNGTVEGTVTDFDGGGLSGLTLSLSDEFGAQGNDGNTTNSVGFFQFTEVIIARVTLGVSSPAGASVEVRESNRSVTSLQNTVVDASLQVYRVAAQIPGALTAVIEDLSTTNTIAQSFVPVGSTLRAGIIRVSPMATVTVRADAGGVPDTTVLGTIDPEFSEMANPKTFAADVPVTAGNTYWLVFRTPNGESVYHLSGNVYSAGTVLASSDSGTTWTASISGITLTDIDIMFVLYY